MSLTGEEIAPSKSKELANKLLGTCREVRRRVGTLLVVKFGIKCLVQGLGMPVRESTGKLFNLNKKTNK